LSQQGYMKKVVEKFKMHESKPVSTPLGQHDKLSTKVAPNSDEERERMTLIPYSNSDTYVVNMVSRFMIDPGPTHWGALKWVFRYLNGSLSSSLKFKRKMKSEKPIRGYTDSVSLETSLLGNLYLHTSSPFLALLLAGGLSFNQLWRYLQLRLSSLLLQNLSRKLGGSKGW